MALAKGSTYDNVFYDFVLSPLKNLFKDEFASSAVYIHPEIKNKGNFEIKLWGSGATTEDRRQQAWAKIYIISVEIYLREANPNEKFYEILYLRAERAYQLLFNNITKETTVGSTTLTWIDGEVGEMLINEFNEGEEEIDGLNKITLDFSCIIER